MPVNSFDNYYMSWKPNKNRLSNPLYLSLAKCMEEDIEDYVLKEGIKLPPQRELADFLDISLNTVTKAYNLCKEKGLLYGVAGSGTFVSQNAGLSKTILSEEKINKNIDMAMLVPFYNHNKIIQSLAIEILQQPNADKYLEYTHPLGNCIQKQAAKKYLNKFNVNAKEENIIIANGTQNALMLTLVSLFKPRDKIATDTYTYANFIGLANLLHIELVSINGDDKGMLPESLDNLCKIRDIHGVYLSPSCSNPTNITMRKNRREEIAHVIKKHDLILIEDDIYAFILDNPLTPVYSVIPEQSVYIGGISKSICPGLRIAYMSFPDKFRKKLENGVYSCNLKTSSLNVEIATQLILKDMYEDIICDKRRMAIRRNKIFKKYFPDLDEGYNENSYYQWICLPKGITGRIFELEGYKRNLKLYSSERFSVGDTQNKFFIRLATCSSKNVEEFENGLSILSNIIDECK
ncbi:TPA: PLP-dependent aminotransferase family protein [Clostridioides difficile]|uniref:aminotransferase-like domain-containing protein n=1 Tax=Clostridioides difficile TaxID=1496 RepID=UPI0010B4B45F|nr:PLP-dependent aminotransferase family protein [Clostridioides difficile]VHY42429.1 GntR family transcriptional regulator [Clostridioides difficile]